MCGKFDPELNEKEKKMEWVDIGKEKTEEKECCCCCGKNCCGSRPTSKAGTINVTSKAEEMYNELVGLRSACHIGEKELNRLKKQITVLNEILHKSYLFATIPDSIDVCATCVYESQPLDSKPCIDCRLTGYTPISSTKGKEET
jgi:hypothetical protein